MTADETPAAPPASTTTVPSSAAAPAAPAASAPVARARPYWRLLWLVPGLALLAVGFVSYRAPGDGGLVQAIRASTREGLAGEASDAIARAKFTSPDYFLVVHTTKTAEPIKTEPFEDTPLGDGLTWTLPTPVERKDILKVEVWDANGILPDNMEDHMSFTAPDGWTAVGQTFRVELQGQRHEPPRWAWWVGGAGALLTLWAVVLFVKDQVI